MNHCDKFKPRQTDLFPDPFRPPDPGLCRYFDPPKTCNLPSVLLCETYGRKEWEPKK